MERGGGGVQSSGVVAKERIDGMGVMAAGGREWVGDEHHNRYLHIKRQDNAYHLIKAQISNMISSGWEGGVYLLKTDRLGVGSQMVYFQADHVTSPSTLS